jgi:hypothetical protein
LVDPPDSPSGPSGVAHSLDEGCSDGVLSAGGVSGIGWAMGGCSTAGIGAGGFAMGLGIFFFGLALFFFTVRLAFFFALFLAFRFFAKQ